MSSPVPSPILVTGGAGFIGSSIVHREAVRAHRRAPPSDGADGFRIDWPVKVPLLSPRDDAAPALADAPILPAYRPAP